MHAMGVARRDLKMDNMLLKARADGAARLKLADFGLCREMGHQRMDASLAYAKVYRPPEIVLVRSMHCPQTFGCWASCSVSC